MKKSVCITYIVLAAVVGATFGAWANGGGKKFWGAVLGLAARVSVVNDSGHLIKNLRITAEFAPQDVSVLYNGNKCERKMEVERETPLTIVFECNGARHAVQCGEIDSGEALTVKIIDGGERAVITWGYADAVSTLAPTTIDTKSGEVKTF